MLGHGEDGSAKRERSGACWAGFGCWARVEEGKCWVGPRGKVGPAGVWQFGLGLVGGLPRIGFGFSFSISSFLSSFLIFSFSN